MYKLITFIIILCSTYAHANNDELSIIAFTSSNYPIQNIGSYNKNTYIYMLDAVNKIENDFAEQYFKGLNENAARNKALNMKNSVEINNFKIQLNKAYEGITKAFQLGIKKIPAIVFVEQNNNIRIIYGLTDINQALQEYKTYKLKK